jgi:hypothetical protein
VIISRPVPVCRRYVQVRCPQVSVCQELSQNDNSWFDDAPDQAAVVVGGTLPQAGRLDHLAQGVRRLRANCRPVRIPGSAPAGFRDHDEGRAADAAAASAAAMRSTGESSIVRWGWVAEI